MSWFVMLGNAHVVVDLEAAEHCWCRGSNRPTCRLVTVNASRCKAFAFSVYDNSSLPLFFDLWSGFDSCLWVDGADRPTEIRPIRPFIWAVAYVKSNCALWPTYLFWKSDSQKWQKIMQYVLLKRVSCDHSAKNNNGKMTVFMTFPIVFTLLHTYTTPNWAKHKTYACSVSAPDNQIKTIWIEGHLHKIKLP